MIKKIGQELQCLKGQGRKRNDLKYRARNPMFIKIGPEL